MVLSSILTLSFTLSLVWSLSALSKVRHGAKQQGGSTDKFDARDKYGMTPLQLSATLGLKKMFKHILKGRTKLVTQSPDHGSDLEAEHTLWLPKRLASKWGG